MSYFESNRNFFDIIGQVEFLFDWRKGTIGTLNIDIAIEYVKFKGQSAGSLIALEIFQTFLIKRYNNNRKLILGDLW